MEEGELSIWVGQFVEESKSNLSSALMISRLTVEIISQGGSFDDSYIKEASANARTPYERALKVLPEGSREREMLKDAYAFLLSVFEDFPPRVTENLTLYEKRIAERIFQFNVLANRLALGG